MVFILFLIIAANCVVTHAITVRSCEGSVLNITCENANQIIYIFSANYGRTSTRICPKVGLDKNTNCSSNNTLEVVRRRCQNNKSCSINANNTEFGDPCVNTYKYLEINYTCANQCRNHENLGCKICEPECEFPRSLYYLRRFCPMIPADGNCENQLGCVCAGGYVRDKRTKLCVAREYCPLPGCLCFTNEQYSECGASCQPSCFRNYYLDGIIRPEIFRFPFPRICRCVSGYICNTGYLRDPASKKCVRPIECSSGFNTIREY